MEWRCTSGGRIVSSSQVLVLYVNDKGVACKHIHHSSTKRAQCCVSLGMGASVVAAFAHTSAVSVHEQVARSVLLESTLEKTLIL